jgi:hypothetical protein
MMIMMFCVNSLDMMQVLHTKLTQDQIKIIVDWTYSRQSPLGGFDGGPDCRTIASDGQ